MSKNTLPEIRKPGEECPRCELVMDEYVTRKTDDGLCPRCCYDIDNTIDMESTELVPDGYEEEKRGAIAFSDLMLILNNWCQGYLRLITQKGVDWSLPHELLEDFTDQMVPYIVRLRDMGYATPERMLAIGDTVSDCIQRLIIALEAEEGLMRLTGQWDDKEQGIKEYWEENSGHRLNYWELPEWPRFPISLRPTKFRPGWKAGVTKLGRSSCDCGMTNGSFALSDGCRYHLTLISKRDEYDKHSKKGRRGHGRK